MSHMLHDPEKLAKELSWDELTSIIAHRYIQDTIALYDADMRDGFLEPETDKREYVQEMACAFAHEDYIADRVEDAIKNLVSEYNLEN